MALLYEGSKIKAKTSLYVTMYYAISNGLSYKAIDQLISLIKVHAYKQDNNILYIIRFIVPLLLCPSNFYQLKKFLETMISHTARGTCSLSVPTFTGH